MPKKRENPEGETIASKEEPLKKEEKEEKQTKEEMKKEKLMQLQEKERETFNSLRKVKYKSLVSNCYSEMDAYTEMVIDGISTGALIEGSGGTGKTYRVINKALSRCNGEDEDEMAYTDSYTTPQALYTWLYKNRDKKVLVVDDVAGFMNNDKVLAFLKGALWEVNGKRLINYMTSKPIKDEFEDLVPNTFEMNAGIIIITNFVNKKNPHVQAVLTRINYCNVEIPRKELLEILGQIAQQGYKELSKQECAEIFYFLSEKTSESTVNLNIRSLFKMFQFKVYSKKCGNSELWKTLSLKMLQKDDRLVIVEALVKDESFASEAEREIEFYKLTGEKRATYYRLKKQLEE